MESNNRRQFLKKSFIGISGAALITFISKESGTKERPR